VSGNDVVLENSKAVPLAAAQRQERDVEKLVLAARNSDPQAIAATARSLARRAPKLAEQVRIHGIATRVKLLTPSFHY
jgi:hypothetical protein